MPKSNPNLTSIFTDVANAIREKKSESGSIYPVDFADEISTIVTANLPTLEPPDLYDGTLSSPFRINTKTQNGVFIDGVDYRIDEKTYQDSFHVRIDTNPEGITPWIYGITPLEGGTFTVFAKGKGENFNDSQETSKSITIPSATETPGYCSVAGLGNEDPTSQLYTYDPDFPRSFQEVQDIYGNTFIKIPTIYRKILNVTDGQITSFAISTSALDSDFKPYPCFIDRSNDNAILPYILIGKWNISSNEIANSVDVQWPQNMSIDKARNLVVARGIGYQLYDWQIHQLIKDLGLLASRYVNIEKTSGGAIYSIFGICHQNMLTYIDGIVNGSAEYPKQWYFAYNPSDYRNLDGYMQNTEEFILSHNYVKASYSAPTGNIVKLGYDKNNPFFNQPETGSTISGKYYCDAVDYRTYSGYGNNYVVYICIGINWYQYGWFFTGFNNQWGYGGCRGRLCYRPILNATGYTE